MLQCHLAQGKAAHPERFPGGNVFVYVIWFEFSSGLGALVQEPWQKCKIQDPKSKMAPVVATRKQSLIKADILV